VSEGYDFNPFQESRFGLRDPSSPFVQNQTAEEQNSRDDPGIQIQTQGELFSDADLAYRLAEVTRQANRANTTIYAIDPRGLVAGPGLDQQVDPTEWTAYVRKSQDTMRVLAEETGGIAVVNMNNFDTALQRIDAETSDYYVLGYYSTNPDPTHRRRKIDVQVVRPDVDVTHSRTEYVLRPPPRPTPMP
jgi:VWFA-related protein